MNKFLKALIPQLFLVLLTACNAQPAGSACTEALPANRYTAASSNSTACDES